MSNELNSILKDVKEKGVLKINTKTGDEFIVMTAKTYCEMKESIESFQQSVQSLLNEYKAVGLPEDGK